MELLASMEILFSPTALLLIMIGTFLGITVGAIPGLTGTMLIALSLPLTFTMTPINALVLLIGMYVGAISGGLITAILLRMPGTGAAIMTTLDGYPMAQKGEAARALGLGISASFFGCLVSWVILALLSRPLAEWAVRFGPFEIFSLVLMAMILIVSVSRGSMLLGLISALLGMLAAMFGTDQASGQLRLTFGFHQMDAGFSMLPMMIGVFAVGKVIGDIVSINSTMELKNVSGRVIMSLADLKTNFVNLMRSSGIGTAIGILPGVGANIGSIVSYTTAKNMSKTPEAFGTGSPEGVVASEAANNATVGGALVPLIAMGIPGSVVDVILLGALMIHQITPGPLLFTTNPDLVYAMIGSVLIANVMMFLMMTTSIRQIAKLVMVPRSRLLPIILVFCVIGVFSLHNRFFDVWVMLAFGVFGYVAERFKMPLAPFVIGFILAPMAESNLRTGLMISDGSYEPLVTRPISALFVILAIVMLAWQIYQAVKLSRSSSK